MRQSQQRSANSVLRIQEDMAAGGFEQNPSGKESEMEIIRGGGGLESDLQVKMLTFKGENGEDEEIKVESDEVNLGEL